MRPRFYRYLAVLLWIGVGSAASGAQVLREPELCVKVSFSKEAVDFTFFVRSDSDRYTPVRVESFRLEARDPRLFSWGVEAKDHGSVHRVTYGVVPRGFVRSTRWYGDHSLQDGAWYRLSAFGNHGRAMVWFIPGVTPEGVCIPDWD